MWIVRPFVQGVLVALTCMLALATCSVILLKQPSVTAGTGIAVWPFLCAGTILLTVGFAREYRRIQRGERFVAVTPAGCVVRLGERRRVIPWNRVTSVKTSRILKAVRITDTPWRTYCLWRMFADRTEVADFVRRTEHYLARVKSDEVTDHRGQAAVPSSRTLRKPAEAGCNAGTV